VRYKQTVLGGLWASFSRPLPCSYSPCFWTACKDAFGWTPYPIFVYAGLLPGLILRMLCPPPETACGKFEPHHKGVLSAHCCAFFCCPCRAARLLHRSVCSGSPHDLVPGSPGPGIFFFHFSLPSLSFVLWGRVVAFGSQCPVSRHSIRDPFSGPGLDVCLPVIYPVSLVHGNYQWLLALNPMGGVIHAYRASLLGHQPIDWGLLGLSTLIILALFLGGLYYFRRMEKVFADVV